MPQVPAKVQRGGAAKMAMTKSLTIVVLVNLSTSAQGFFHLTPRIAAGGSHGCLVDDEGIKCWGSNKFGQSTAPDLSDPQLIAAHGAKSCAIASGSVHCWGGGGLPNEGHPPLTNPSQLEIGGDFACVLDEGEVLCWGGNNHYGQTDVPPLTNPRQIALGSRHGCALADEGVVCWGSNDWHQTAVPPLERPTQIASYHETTCVIDASAVKCWGGSSASRLPEVRQDFYSPRRLAVGGSRACVLDGRGNVWCWGESGGPSHASGTSMIGLTGGAGFFCGVQDDELKCWGAPANGNLFPPTHFYPTEVSVRGTIACARDGERVRCWDSKRYLPIPELSHPHRVVAGTCAIDDNGLQCWNTYGQVVTVPDLVNPRDISLGFPRCALDETGARCWNGSLEFDVPNLTNPRTISSGRGHICAIDDGGVHCWGENNYGQTDVPLLQNPRQVVAGQWVSCAIDDSGLQCWGEERGTRPALNDIEQIALGSISQCALDREGVKCWGSDDNGVSDVPRLANPVQVAVGQVACAVDETGAPCWGKTHYRGKFPSLVSMVGHVRLDLAMSPHFRELSQVLYREKRTFLEGLSTLVDGRSEDDQVLAFLLLEPFFSDLEVPAAHGVSQDYERTKAALANRGWPSLTSLDQSSDSLRLSLRILAGAFTNVRGLVAIGSRDLIDRIVTRLGRTTAQSHIELDEVGEIATFINAQGALIEDLNGSPRLKPFGALVKNVLDWFES